MLELAGRTDVEVALGDERPLVRPVETTPETHGPQGLGYAELPPADPPAQRPPRRGLWSSSEVRRPARRDHARDLRPADEPRPSRSLREPELPRLLRRWVLMGGAYRVPGNTAPTTEWNIHCDPDAAKIAFAAWASRPATPRPIALGLDVTEQAKILPDHVVELARRRRQHAGRLDRAGARRGPDARDPVGRQQSRSSASSPTRSASTWSSTPATTASTARSSTTRWPTAAALDPSLVRTEALAVDVELDGTLTAGETVTDWRGVWGRPPNVDVAVEADAEEFLRRFVERVGGLAARLATAQT